MTFWQLPFTLKVLLYFMGRLSAGTEAESSHFVAEFEPQAEEDTEQETPELYQTLPEVNEIVEAALKAPETQAQAIWEKFVGHLADIKKNLAEGHIDKNLARVEIDTLIAEIKTLRDEWLGKKSPEAVQKLEGLLAEFKVFRKEIATRMEKFRRFMAGPLVGLGVLGAAKVGQEYQQFEEAKNATAELLKSADEFSPPPVPDSFLIMPESVEVPDTSYLFKQFKRYVSEHPKKGLGLSVEESGPGLLGVYLKFGHQIDRSIKFSEKFAPELANLLAIPETELQTMRGIFQESIYVQPPVMGSGYGTSSIFYTSENYLPLKNHEDFYTKQVNSAVELAKHAIPQIEKAPKNIQTKLRQALVDFLKSELAVRAYDERIKDAIANQREFELEGVKGAYNDDVPSLFSRQNFHIEKRTQAIETWYGTLAETQPGAQMEKHLVELAINLQGWAEKRKVALEVSTVEGEKGMLLGSGSEKWNEFVVKGDKEYHKNLQALQTLLAEYQTSTAPAVAMR